MTLLNELIDIPEHIDKGQFVLRLTEGVTDPRATVESYVPTPQLVRCFDDALTWIRGSLQNNLSKATYLHGSFGSGKSHFMAILHLILQGNDTARSIPELTATIQKHNDWVTGKKFLLVPYHMIGAHDVDSGILGGYVDYVRRTHPDAPIPGVYLAEGLFRDAAALRQKMGDDSFFATLNEGSSSTDGGWGDLTSGWDAARFEAAMQLDPGSEERSQLISALMSQFFSSYDTQASSRGEAFLSLDKGLSVISRHAQSLGYDGLILFLDELILWLASHAADLQFIHQEGQKLSKLVEAQTADRPIPIISFVARQRDLSELIGETVPGAERLNFGDALKHWDGRFHKITLEDRNLPAIAERRVLRCRSTAARTELNAAFEKSAPTRESVMSTLLTSDGDRDMFRRVYPFSPALVQTLIAVSSVLQRERTALKVMMQLLVDHRETLKVGDLVPVGDLFDVIAHGDEAFSQEMALHFDNAKRLYHQKLLPMLEQQHGRWEELQERPFDDPKRTLFRADDRLVKTLLLSSLVPEVETLRSLNSERLAALNHGTIRTPIPGREAQEVLRRCRTWAASVGEIRIGEESNPTISLQLSGVDTESIIRQAEREDNQGNRVRRVRQMLFEQLGIDDNGEIQQEHTFFWKNTRRTAVVLFRNIRDLNEPSFENGADDYWKLVVDFPFDDSGHGPRDDLSKLQSFRESHPGGAKTLCWIPQFFSKQASHDLGLLVILDHILAGERFAQYAGHLSPQDRHSAKALLENQRSVLKQRVLNHLDTAYGLESVAPGSLDTTHELEPHEQFVSLWRGFDPRPPVAANLKDALQGLLSQALESEYPAAPTFGCEVRTAVLKKVQTLISEAIQTPDGRLAVEKTLRPMLQQIANPLLLGEMGHDVTHFLLKTHWQDHFTRKAAETGGVLTVGRLREWIDQPRPMGLPTEAQNLIILTFAEQTNRTIMHHNSVVDASLTSLHSDYELRLEELPDLTHWNISVQRAATIFGETPSPLLKASNVSSLTSAIRQRSSSLRGSIRNYTDQLRRQLTKRSPDPEAAPRLQTATAALQLVEALCHAEPRQAVQVLATATVATAETAMGECLAKAQQLQTVLDSTNWEMFSAIRNLASEYADRAATIEEQVLRALQNDEHVLPLGAALKEAQSQALRLITMASQSNAAAPAGGTQVSPPPGTTPVPPAIAPQITRQTVSQGQQEGLDGTAAAELLQQLQKDLKQGQTLRLNLSWVVEQNGDDA